MNKNEKNNFLNSKNFTYNTYEKINLIKMKALINYLQDLKLEGKDTAISNYYLKKMLEYLNNINDDNRTRVKKNTTQLQINYYETKNYIGKIKSDKKKMLSDFPLKLLFFSIQDQNYCEVNFPQYIDLLLIKNYSNNLNLKTPEIDKAIIRFKKNGRIDRGFNFILKSETIQKSLISSELKNFRLKLWENREDFSFYNSIKLGSFNNFPQTKKEIALQKFFLNDLKSNYCKDLVKKLEVDLSIKSQNWNVLNDIKVSESSLIFRNNGFFIGFDKLIFEQIHESVNNFNLSVNIDFEIKKPQLTGCSEFKDLNFIDIHVLNKYIILESTLTEINTGLFDNFVTENGFDGDVFSEDEIKQINKIYSKFKLNKNPDFEVFLEYYFAKNANDEINFMSEFYLKILHRKQEIRNFLLDKFEDQEELFNYFKKFKNKKK